MEQIKRKVCICCGKNLPVTEFYRNKGMNDGLLGKCKECQKENSRMNYRKNRRERIKYEREREQRPERKQKKLEYQRRMRERNPDKYRARTAVANAVRDGRLQKMPCECGSLKSQAHHEDYSKPLDVIWMCRRCHMIHHDKNPF